VKHDGKLFRLVTRFSDYSTPFAARVYSPQALRLLSADRSKRVNLLLQARGIR
jgi:hypothetical protein